MKRAAAYIKLQAKLSCSSICFQENGDNSGLPWLKYCFVSLSEAVEHKGQARDAPTAIRTDSVTCAITGGGMTAQSAGIVTNFSIPTAVPGK